MSARTRSFAISAGLACVVSFTGPASLAPAQSAATADESNYYKVDLIPTKPDAIEVGGLDFLPDGRLAVSTRHGQVWIVSNPCAPNPADAKLSLFAEGLYEGLGLAVVGGEICVLQRTELSRLRDTDGDGRCDTIDTISDDWGVSGNYHEFAYGLPHDRDGNFFIALNVGFQDPKWWHGKSLAPWRGWVLRIRPDGRSEPFACGFRSPNGLCLSPDGDLFATDNQGDWLPSCPIYHVKKDEFYGHPASLEWTDEYHKLGRHPSDTEPPERPRKQAAVWIPYGMSRSAGNPAFDTTAGRFGPFSGSMFVAELTNGCVMRADLEKVEGEWQGSILQFRRGTGSANRIAFAPDGTLFVGLTNRGWGGAPPADGIARVRWTGRVPMEVKHLHLESDGFTASFTLPLAADCAPAAASLHVVQYDYNSWWDYGSPEVHVTPVDVAAVELAPERTSLRIHAPKLQAGMCARLLFDGIAGQGSADGRATREPLLHPQIDYTINRLPGKKQATPVAKTVAPPPARQDVEEGWVTLLDRRSIEAFTGEGWRRAAVHMDPADPTRFAEHEMVDDWDGMLVNAPGAHDALSIFELGDCEARIEFCVTKNSNSGVYFMGRYEVQILDSFGKKEVGYGDCGGIYEGDDLGPDGKNGFAGSAPKVNACNAPGEWQRYDVRFRAPRFDASGRKVANAKFESVKLNGQLVQENVEVTNPTRGAFDGPEVAVGPLRLQGDHGPVAYRNIRLKPLADADPAADSTAGSTPDPDHGKGWVKLFDGKSIDGCQRIDEWKRSGEAQWSVEDGILVGRGKTGHLFSPRGDYVNVEQRCSAMINGGGNSGFYFRTAFGDGFPSGYEAQINASHTDPQRTGSLEDLAPVTIPLLAANVWFDYRVRCVDEPAGTHIQIWVNHLKTVDFIDKERRHKSGHLALQQHDEASEVRFRSIEVRELEGRRE
jgi:glucose/arabinose dehydrogenase